MNTILNALFVLARAQLVDPCPGASASDPIEELGTQLTTFRTHSAPDPIAEPLYEPPLVRPHSESEKSMMYGSASSIVRGHSRGTSSDSTLTVSTTSISIDVTNMSFSPIMESSSP